jgi:NAD-dependent deacetylase
MRVLVITGAGISAESGIPTFRGKDGYWRNLDPTKLATPEAFEKNPKLVWEWYRERRQWIRNAKPNAAHEAIVRLSILAQDFLLVTQNVDDLHRRAGLAKEKMVQIHGDIFVTRCSRCNFQFRHFDNGHIDEVIDCFKQSSVGSSEDVDLLKCPKCGAFMRPGVVWFGEQLDSRKIDIVEKFLSRGACDYVFVIGTSALFGYIVDWATRSGGKLIEINPDGTPLSRFVSQSIRESATRALPNLVEQMIGSE